MLQKIVLDGVKYISHVHPTFGDTEAKRAPRRMDIFKAGQEKSLDGAPRYYGSLGRMVLKGPTFDQ